MREIRRCTTAARRALPGIILLVSLSVHAGAEEAPDAIAEIEKLGGLVIPIGDEWEVDFHLQGREITDDCLVHVAALKNVAWLNLKGTKVTSAGLVHFKGLVGLRSLHLEETSVNDEGIEHLAALPKLKYLNLYGTQITDVALKKLTRAKQLRRLYIWRTKVTEEGAASLAGQLPELRVIGGVDLSKLPANFPKEVAEPSPKMTLDWVAVTRRADAPARSENGINCQVWFENRSEQSVKLYWISYGNGELKLYATISPGETHKQNTYSRNAWLISDESDKPLGYFVAEANNALAIVPK